jgi:hypothetical protein
VIIGLAPGSIDCCGKQPALQHPATGRPQVYDVGTKEE